MPYLQPPLIPPFRYRPRARSEVTTPSLYVVRTGRSHTVFTMVQTDGANECKPTRPPSEDASHPSKFRTRFAGLFTSSKQKDTSPSKADGVVKSEEDAADRVPMRLLSPRATECVVPTFPAAKRRTFSLKSRLSSRKSIGNAPPSPVRLSESEPVLEKEKEEVASQDEHAPVTNDPQPETNDTVQTPEIETDCVTSGGRHIPVTETPYSCKDQVDMSATAELPPIREAALTSHPMFVLEVESEEKFVTPQTSFFERA